MEQIFLGSSPDIEPGRFDLIASDGELGVGNDQNVGGYKVFGGEHQSFADGLFLAGIIRFVAERFGLTNFIYLTNPQDKGLFVGEEDAG